jgi:CheY-like chemotaxis protein
VDQAQLEAALLNLIINARDAMPGGGQLTLRTANVTLDTPAPGDDATPGDYVMVAVNDVGTGVPPEIRDRVFEPFFTTKAIGKGTGLGLSMVIGFAKQSGGFVRLESEPGEGTSVQIYFPRANAESGQDGGVGTMSDWMPGPCRVLIVEDRPDVLAAVCRISEEIGLLATPARNAEEALAVLRSGARFELLFTDIVLGGAMDGLDLAQEAKRMMPGLQVLLTTGYSEAVLKHGKRVEEAVVLAKPYTKAQFLAALRKLLGEKVEGRCPGV